MRTMVTKFRDLNKIKLQVTLKLKLTLNIKIKVENNIKTKAVMLCMSPINDTTNIMSLRQNITRFTGAINCKKCKMVKQ